MSQMDCTTRYVISVCRGVQKGKVDTIHHGRWRSVGLISVGEATATPALALAAVLRSQSAAPRGACGRLVGDTGEALAVDAAVEVVGNAFRASGTGRESVEVGTDSLRAISGDAMVTNGMRGLGALTFGAVIGRRGRVGGKIKAGVPIAWYDLREVASSDSWNVRGAEETRDVAALSNAEIDSPSP